MRGVFASQPLRDTVGASRLLLRFFHLSHEMHGEGIVQRDHPGQGLIAVVFQGLQDVPGREAQPSRAAGRTRQGETAQCLHPLCRKALNRK